METATVVQYVNLGEESKNVTTSFSAFKGEFSTAMFHDRRKYK